MNRKFVSKSNRVLRKILNSKENLDIVKDFIETFLKIKIKEIKLNSYLEKKSKFLPQEENFGIADVRVKLINEEELNIGIQFIDGYYAQSKMLLYYAQIHSNQLEFNDGRAISKTVTINLLDFNCINSKEYLSKITIPCSKESSQIELYVIELPKFSLNKLESLSNREAWMAYFCGAQKNQMQYAIKNYKYIKKLDDLLENYWKNEIME